MKNSIFITLIIFSSISLNAQGVLNVDEAIIMPGPLNSLNNEGSGTFSFDIYESVAQPVGYIDGQQAGISITLTYISLVDGINSISGYEPYFDIAVIPYNVTENDQLIFLSQIADIPADAYLNIEMDIIVRADSDAAAPKNGGAVTLEPAGTQGGTGAGQTDIFTYTCYLPIDDYAEGSACYELLPIELLRFNALPGQNHVLLEWETATELNNSHFDIERSADGRHYQKIGEVAGQGTTSEVVEYTFTDEAPLSGKSFYRLKQVDYDGAFVYSHVEEVNRNSDSELKLFPNPVAVGSEFRVEGRQIRSVQVFNLLGQLVLEESYDRPQDQVFLSTDHLAQGMYITRINDTTEKRMIIK